jgi:hypothetical protein
VTGWVIVEANDMQGGLQNSIGDFFQGMDGLTRTRESHPVDQWQKWIQKGSKWNFGFVNSGDFVSDFWKNNHLGPTDYQKNVSHFLTSKGNSSLTNKYPLFPNAL